MITKIVLLLSTRKPIRLAGKVSAIEAVRSTAYTAVPKRSEKQVHGRLTLYRLAAMNFSRSPKKAALTLASLGFTGILLMCIDAYSSSEMDNPLDPAALETLMQIPFRFFIRKSNSLPAV